MDWLETLAKEIARAAQNAVAVAKFDKTTFGSITGIAGDVYTVFAWGKSYQVKSSKSFHVGQQVAVTAPQNDYKRLLLDYI